MSEKGKKWKLSLLEEREVNTEKDMGEGNNNTKDVWFIVSFKEDLVLGSFLGPVNGKMRLCLYTLVENLY